GLKGIDLAAVDRQLLNARAFHRVRYYGIVHVDLRRNVVYIHGGGRLARSEYRIDNGTLRRAHGEIAAISLHTRGLDRYPVWPRNHRRKEEHSGITRSRLGGDIRLRIEKGHGGIRNYRAGLIPDRAGYGPSAGLGPGGNRQNGREKKQERFF